jgi:hypothetical protein
MRRTTLLLLLAWAGLLAQSPEDTVLPSGKRWRDELIRADHEQNRKEAKELARLSSEIQQELEAGDRNVLSFTTLKKVERAEQLAKSLKNRLVRR